MTLAVAMPLIKISIPSSESSKDLSQHSSLYNHARRSHFPAELAFYLNSLLTLEPPVLREKLVDIQRLIPIDVHIHTGYDHDNKSIQRGQIQIDDVTIETDHDRALYPGNSMPTQTMHTLESRTEIDVSVQPRPLSEEGSLVIEPEHFVRGLEESAVEGTKLGDTPLKENELESDESLSPGLLEPDSPDNWQPETGCLSNRLSPSLQLQQDLSNFIDRLRVSISPREDNLLQSNQSRSHIIDQANHARKRKHINYDDSRANEKLNSAGRKRSRTRNIVGTHSSPLNEAESIRLNLLRTLMKRAGQFFNIATLRHIHEMGDRIMYETNVILRGWNEWLSRECQAPGVVLPAYHNLSSAEICFAACRLLVSTHESFHDESVYRRLAQVLLHVFVPEIEKEVKGRQDRGERFLKPNHRKPVTIAHDLIVENVSECERNGKKLCRQNLVQHKNFGKRWWRLGNGIGLVIILTCSSDLATSYMKSRSFCDAEIDLLVNYVRNAYPRAVAHFQSLDPIIQRLIANVSLSADDIVHPYPSFLRFEALPKNIQWTETESAMGVATEKLLRSLSKTKE